MTAPTRVRGVLAGVLASALTLGMAAGCDTKGEAPEPIPTATATPAPQTEFVVGGKNYSITFPGKPTHSTEVAKRGLKLTTEVYILRTEDANFSISRVSYAGHDAPSLRAALQSAASQTGGRLTTSRTYKYRGQPAIEGTIVGTLKSDREAAVTIRYILVDNKILIGLIYVPKVKATKSTKKVRDAWLESLKFQTPPKSAGENSTESTGTETSAPLPG
jgi:hypothetical protein